MTKPVMEDSQTHANIIGAVSEDSKISLARKCREEGQTYWLHQHQDGKQPI